MSFEEIAALGCHIEGEPELNVTPALVTVWFEEETEEREAGIAADGTSQPKNDDYMCAG